MNDGASVPDRALVPSGSSQQAVSPVPASIPSADDLLRTIRKTVADWGEIYRSSSGHRVDPGYLASLANDIAFELGILEAAQAIEAGTAETGTGSVHESAVRQDAPNSSNPETSDEQ